MQAAVSLSRQSSRKRNQDKRTLTMLCKILYAPLWTSLHRLHERRVSFIARREAIRWFSRWSSRDFAGGRYDHHGAGGGVIGTTRNGDKARYSRGVDVLVIILSSPSAHGASVAEPSPML